MPFMSVHQSRFYPTSLDYWLHSLVAKEVEDLFSRKDRISRVSTERVVHRTIGQVTHGKLHQPCAIINIHALATQY